MIQTGARIHKLVLDGSISIDPFVEEQVNPNSYNYRLGPLVRKMNGSKVLHTHDLRGGRLRLEPNTVYLGHTLERIGSSQYVTLLNGRSSLGRLGLFLNYSADLGHHGAVHCWTLELMAVQPLWVYFGMEVGQASFWRVQGDGPIYDGRLGKFDVPMPADPTDLERKG